MNQNRNNSDYFSWWTGRDLKNYTYWHGDKGVNDTGCACAEDNSCKRFKIFLLKNDYYRYFILTYYKAAFFSCLYLLSSLIKMILSLNGGSIKCNCDDEKTGLTDDNLLQSKNKLPVSGKVILIP